MRIVLFAHSLVSCWNHGNAHFLRGVVRALIALGHEVRVYEPGDAWSRSNLVADGHDASAFVAAYPELTSIAYALPIPPLRFASQPSPAGRGLGRSG